MHVLHGHAAVNDFHSIVCQDVGNRASASLIYFSKFCRLIRDIGIIQHPADPGNILRIGIIGAGFSPAPGG